MLLKVLTQFLDDYLAVMDCPDIALNGLQVESSVEVGKIALAVDACSETFQKAASLKADMLITHHGLFWGKQFALTGIHANRVKSLMDRGISLYSAHLPLDIHPESGNNTGLMRLLGFQPEEPFGEYKGIKIGYTGTSDKLETYSSLLKKLKKVLGVQPVGYHFGNDSIKKIAVISGGGSFALEEVTDTDIDLFITGSLHHESYHLAKELKVNLVFCGHYATETIGVRRLGRIIEEKFSIETVFIDVPTGM